jgi:hypothetical protein
LKRFLIVIGLALTLLGAGAGVAYASIPAPDGVIHGCYKTSTGMLIAIDSSASCPSGYTALNWNQTGPQGPAGSPGLSGIHVVTLVNAPQYGELDCPSGEVALSAVAQSGSVTPVVDANNRPIGYQYGLQQSGALTVFVTCAVSS